ncbi:2-acylglycerophosphoethanolamine acyltransferase [Candidatus Similichlamydia laticola]|uniref:2-acylglycerophosphoethanolamine acyltransferase n=2 Tax=Candidatus Similichlamydia laticola TaxID=2170265 RepID=A0A369KIP9_9BACT|nr:2-acylglycerophosphoethanolamine acyltransferase [Candidatus Similichlamydia laticola]
MDVRGIDRIRQRSGEGILFLCSYSSVLDPVLVNSLLIMDGVPVRILAYEQDCRRPLTRLIMRWLRGIPIPDLSSSANPLKKQRSELAFRKLAQSLKMGEIFILHPSGRPKMTGRESLQGTSWAYRLTQEVPGLRVVLVRISGLWGSRFSTIWEKRSPSFFRMFWEWLKMILKNGIFFAIKRQVVISFQEMNKTGYSLSRDEFNQYIEDWLNQYEHDGQKEGDKGETPTFVPEAFYNRTVQTPQEREADTDPLDSFECIPREIQEPIFQEVSRLTGVSLFALDPHADLVADLGLGSADRAALLASIHQRFGKLGLRDAHASTVGHLVRSVSQKIKTLPNRRKGAYFDPTFREWFSSRERVPVATPVGTILQEAFLRSCDRGGNSIACADLLSGSVSYKRLKRQVLLLAREMKYLPGDNLGVMLPSSVDAITVLFATFLAGKTPVLIDWTATNQSVRDFLRLADVHVVISSRWFSDELEHVAIKELAPLLLMLEDIEHRHSPWKRMKSYLESYRTADALLDEWDEWCAKSDDTAVILCKNHPEMNPCVIPLTHRNILSVTNSLFSAIPITSQDSIFAVLPPFHSLGFELLNVLPICCAVKFFCYPYPFESVQIACLIQQVRPTVFIGTPFIIESLFQFAKRKELESVRYFIFCGESPSGELLAKVEELGATPMMSYGLTECGAVVAIHRIGTTAKGVGPLLQGVDVAIVDPKSRRPVLPGKEGLILLSGESVFHGYLGGSDPHKGFHFDLQNKKWFETGDRGSLDRDQVLSLTHPNGRWIKVGTRIVSLIELEKMIMQLALRKQWIKQKSHFIPGPCLALCFTRKNKRFSKNLLLVTTFDLDQDVVNQEITERYPFLVQIIGETRKLEAIPLTEVGKVAYHMLDRQC